MLLFQLLNKKLLTIYSFIFNGWIIEIRKYIFIYLIFVLEMIKYLDNYSIQLNKWKEINNEHEIKLLKIILLQSSFF